MNWLKENWRPIIFIPIIGIVIIYIGFQIDKSLVLKDIFALLGYLFLVGIVLKALFPTIDYKKKTLWPTGEDKE